MHFGVSVHMLNNSPHTFLNVDVTAIAHGSGGWSESATVTWPRLTPNPNAVDEKLSVTVVHEDTGERPLVMPSWEAEAVFTDVNGVRWRYASGVLTEWNQPASE